ncbi:hypothetical protein [Vallitalea guaymasensis]|uniref:hypothetical protein n=1 Tax=Vallitalea guaymasensis TaxID=1185412 RepID=UPI0023541476|nr:hypothetical protein [Vallitalea guaymasensis]
MGQTKYNLNTLSEKENDIIEITKKIDYIFNRFKMIKNSIDIDITRRDNIDDQFNTLTNDFQNIIESTYNSSQIINKAVMEYSNSEHQIQNLLNQLLDTSTDSHDTDMTKTDHDEVSISGISLLQNWFERLYNQLISKITHVKKFFEDNGVHINNKDYLKSVVEDDNTLESNVLDESAIGTYSKSELERVFRKASEKEQHYYDEKTIYKRSNIYDFKNMVASTFKGDLSNFVIDSDRNGIPDFIDYYLNQYGGPNFVSIHEEMSLMEETSQVDETYIKKEQLQQIYNNTTITDEMITDLNRVLAKYGIIDVENIQHFIAQTCIETGYGGSIVEKGSDKYLNGKKYGKKYSGVGYIQITWDYGYAAFASYMILESYPDLNDVAKYRNPKSNNRDTIFNEYNKIVSEANNRGYNIRVYTDIVDIGRDYVEKNYAWETAGYYWSINELTSADSNTPVDDVTKIVNKWTDSYEARRDAYNIVKKYIK